jgi:hypothetical protein
MEDDDDDDEPLSSFLHSSRRDGRWDATVAI